MPESLLLAVPPWRARCAKSLDGYTGAQVRLLSDAARRGMMCSALWECLHEGEGDGADSGDQKENKQQGEVRVRKVPHHCEPDRLRKKRLKDH